MTLRERGGRTPLIRRSSPIAGVYDGILPIQLVQEMLYKVGYDVAVEAVTRSRSHFPLEVKHELSSVRMDAGGMRRHHAGVVQFAQLGDCYCIFDAKPTGLTQCRINDVVFAESTETLFAYNSALMVPACNETSLQPLREANGELLKGSLRRRQ